MKEILGEGTLVLLRLKIVLVFGKIFGHGDEFVPDVVPPFQPLVGPGTRLALTIESRTGGKESDRNQGAGRPAHRKGHFIVEFLL
ncbi:MAG TPA: hypothetical protein VKR61_14100 [Bryobacteraceae bacterium]|nr:hypothetical protein [Bryobacteraceae bacterium]